MKKAIFICATAVCLCANDLDTLPECIVESEKEVERSRERSSERETDGLN